VILLVRPVQFTVPKTVTSPSVYDFPQGFAGGLNISVSPDQLATNQSSDTSDCNFDSGGIPSKRYGLTRISDLSLGTTPIRHMIEFPRIEEETEFLAVCGGNIYRKIER